jgi:hypothetical protein
LRWAAWIPPLAARSPASFPSTAGIAQPDAGEIELRVNDSAEPGKGSAQALRVVEILEPAGFEFVLNQVGAADEVHLDPVNDCPEAARQVPTALRARQTSP